MKTSIYKPRGVLIIIGHHLSEGVASEQIVFIDKPCTLFIDNDTDEITIDTDHYTPENWIPTKLRAKLKKANSE